MQSMDVVLSENQTMLQDATRRLVEARYPVEQVRKLSDAGEPFPAGSWAECAGQGWIGLFVPEQFGGVAEEAGGVIDAAIVAEELGRQVFAGPFAPSAVAAFAITQFGDDTQHASYLPGLGSGEITATSCFAGTSAEDGLSPVGLAAKPTDAGYRIDGTAGFVENAANSDLFVVTANDGDGLTQYLIAANHPGVTV
jgi:alkylation response protein AidB-like acyl-CoA dehydrogenase